MDMNEGQVNGVRLFSSLRVRFFFVLVGLATVPVLILGLSAGWRSANELERQSLVLQTELATRVEREIAAFLSARINEMRVLEKTNLLSAMDEDQLSASLGRLLAHDQVYQDLVVLTPSGRIESFVSRTDVFDRDTSHWREIPWSEPGYWESNDVYVGPIEFHVDLREPLVDVAIPVIERRTGQILRILQAHVRVRSIWNLLADIELPSETEAFVTSAEGQILAHSSPAQVLSERRYELPSQDGRHLLANGTRALVVTVPLSMVSQTSFVVVSRPLSVALTEASTLRGTTLVGAVVLMLAASALAFWQSQAIVRPIEKLARQAHDISEGNLETEIEAVGPTEISILGQALKEMTAQLKLKISDLERSEFAERQRAMVTLESIGDAVITTNPEGTVTYINPIAQQLTGWPLDEAIGQPLSSVFNIVNETTREVTPNPVDRCLRTGLIVGLANNTLLVSRDGSEYAISDSAAPIQKANGDVLGVVMVFQDVTERLDIERRLRQSQKLEAIGQLSGGIAHDFNNLMQVIQGNAELLADDPGFDPELTRPILHATKRGKELTARLLAFARKQPLMSQSIDMPHFLEGVVPMLDRTLGETIKVSLEINDGVRPAQADPGQLETALLNLALNAKDALPDGGGLRIQCANAKRAEVPIEKSAVLGEQNFVRISVSDTGTGMTEETRLRAIDPFFTTKGVGEGSGLGLSMVFGFVKQSGGHLAIESTEGSGTTVHIFIPQSQAPDMAKREPKDDRAALEGGSEMILVVEDNTEVRLAARKMLIRLGYKVIEAGTIAEAKDALAGSNAIDLVLTDVVLPGGASGIQFAQELSASRPQLPVVLMSGYPNHKEARPKIAGVSAVLLRKPFQRAELADAIRKSLGQHKDGPW